MKKLILISILTVSTTAIGIVPLASCGSKQKEEKFDATTKAVLQEFCGSDFVGDTDDNVLGITSFYRASNSRYQDTFGAYLKDRVDKLSNYTAQSFVDEETGTIWFDIPASKSCQDWPGIIIQGHTDMVWVTNPDASQIPHHPVPVLDKVGDRQVIHTEGNKTTLGADNGAGLAIGLAAIKQLSTINHGPIRFLFTANEETTMEGAIKVSEIEGFFNGYKYLLNMDTEEQNNIYRSCLGNRELNFLYEYGNPAEEAKETTYKLTINGLHGGHSGLDIGKGYASADRIAMELLCAISVIGTQLCEFNHVSEAKKNSFSKECYVVFKGDDCDIEAINNLIIYLKENVWPVNYPGEKWNDVNVTIEKINNEYPNYINSTDSGNLINFVGGQSLQPDISTIHGLMFGLIEKREGDGFPLLSNNIAPIKIIPNATGGADVSIYVMIRAETSEKMQTLGNKYKDVSPTIGRTEIVETEDRPWIYRGQEQEGYIEYLTTASHVCGRPDAKAIDDIGTVEPSHWYDKILCGAIGNDITGAHTIDETLYIDGLKTGYDTLIYVFSHLNELG